MYNARPIFEFLVDSQERGFRTALVTTLTVTGGSSRGVGALMAVAEDGRHTGSLSGGCIENAVVVEAMDAISTGSSREVRFGAGSPYIDIRLPCGGGIDLLFTPLAESGFARAMLDLLALRRPARMRIDRQNGSAAVAEEAGDSFMMHVYAREVDVTYIPAIRVAIFGHGAAVETLASCARAYGAEIEVFTPDPHIAARCSAHGAAVTRLELAASPPAPDLDRWTAAVFLFHDHDWEPHLLIKALATRAYYIGAMGSRAAHQGRLARLRDLGAGESLTERILAPIGLIPSTRDPETLALSIMAELVDRYHVRFMGAVPAKP